MGIIIKDKSPLISFILTDFGKRQMAIGKLSYDYYAFGDSDIDYRTADINSVMLKPNSNITDLKYLLYRKNNSAFYSMDESNFELTENKTFEKLIEKEFNIKVYQF